MIFQCEGERYNTCAMHEFRTGAAHQPVFYITPDLKSVFVQTMDRAQGVGMHEAGEAEIRRLWDSYGIEGLLRVLATLGGDRATRESCERREHPTTIRSFE